MNQEVGDRDPLNEGTKTIQEEGRDTRRETNHFKKDIKMRKSITQILSRTFVRQRIQQTKMGRTNKITGIEERAGMITQMMIGQNAHRCKKTPQRTIVIKTQP
ncbi:MAG: hypothetical protein EZS28_007308 [Streblomastix strix]|uniref:Uncharacterized protein n=1 Tax=Streblomastix strix TaxID=222440 RepID=A0A5J4WST8_9EUKA|nr:MAG: hypothetical protein EZS28_007308 [Streblomastix strix]